MEAVIVKRAYTGVAARWNQELSELDESNIAGLVRDQDLGALNLAGQVDKLRVIRDIVGSLDGQDERWLHSGVVTEIGSHLSQVLEQRNRMRDFALTTPDPEGIRRGIDNELESHRNWFAQQVTPLGQPNSPARPVLAELQRDLGEAQRIREEMAAILSDLRSQAGTTAASTLSGRYREQASKHQFRGYVFLAAGVVGLVLALGVVYYLTVVEPIRLSLTTGNAWVEFARQLLPRAFAVGVASYIVAFAARNFRINMHLAAVNEHKVNALDTYTLFTEAVTSEAARDSMVAEVVRAVVLHPETGYLGSPDKTIVESGQAAASSWMPPRS